MHNHFLSYKIETIRFCLPRTFYHFLHQTLFQVRNCINGLPRVSSVGDAEGEGEVETLNEFLTEVVTLDHAEVLDWLITHRKGQIGTDLLQFEKVWTCGGMKWGGKFKNFR